MGKKYFKIMITLGAIAVLFSGTVNLSASTSRTFEIKAQKYHFTPAKIEVDQGDRVVLNITAVDTKHGFGIEEYDIDEVLPVDQIITVEFIADKKGTFKIQCTKFCGWGHFGMDATLVVR